MENSLIEDRAILAHRNLLVKVTGRIFAYRKLPEVYFQLL